ncbi:hypothetical protein [Candidatus Methylomirabilis sp.]|uniref:hypothetical protein n=1 Tax=Candidatus Methylomirabilis sp. TaxID=2032687 RepID=UPI0030762038
MARLLESRWPEIKRSARDEDEFHRTTALATAVGCVEVGLAALGISRQGREGLQERLRRANFTDFKGAPDGTHLKNAIEARNRAVHNHTIGDISECRKHVGTLYKAWCALRKVFVTKSNAAKLADAILRTEAVSQVFLFGSLAVPHGVQDPKDIDLLFFDDGEYSWWMSQYPGLGPEALLEEGFITTPPIQAATRCGWLDYIFVDGTRFGIDRKYTLSLAQSQLDPLFFVNISASLRAFNPLTLRWTKTRPQIFERLAAIRRQLEIENIVPSAPTEGRSARWKPRHLTR